MVELVPPDEAYQDSFLEALAELQVEGRRLELAPTLVAADFPAFVARLRALADPAHVRSGRAPETFLWLVDDGAYIGRSSLRPTATEWLRRYGGHIGYEIRPSRRREGYGTTILRLTLEVARAQGFDRVLVTCDETNIGSRKIIEANGGVLESAIAQPGTTVRKRRYWIDLAP